MTVLTGMRGPAAAGLCALVVGCGGGGAESSKPSPPDPSPTPSATRSPIGELQRGTGYELALPEDWSDVTKAFAKTEQARESKVDRIFAGRATGSFATNLVIVRETPREVTLEEALRHYRIQAEELADRSGVGSVEDVEMDGEPAKAFEYRLRKRRPPVRQREVVAIHGKGVYQLVFSASVTRYDQEVPTLERMLASWRWR